MKKLLIILLSLICCSSVFADPIKNIIFFGDSLTDNGNDYAIFKVPESPPYYKGRFSNGFTWAEDLGKYYYNKSYTDYSIYAWGGATAILHNPIYDKFVAPRILEEELLSYYKDSFGADRSQNLYVIWIGANDYLFDGQPDMNALVSEVVNKISSTISSLIDHGAQHFLIMNLPDLSRSPYAAMTQMGPRLNALSVLHNQKLAEAVKAIQDKSKNVDIVSVDIFGIFSNFLDHTDSINQQYHVNIQNTKDSCLTSSAVNKMNAAALSNELQKMGNSDPRATSEAILNSPSLAVAYATGKAYESGSIPCDHAEQYLFWDVMHPTETIHSVLAQMVEQMLAADKRL